MSIYEHVEKYGKHFSEYLGLKNDITENLVCDGDKAEQYWRIFESNGITTEDGAMIYLLSKEPPYSHTVRDTLNGWVGVETWLEEKCQDQTIIRAIDYAKHVDLNNHLIMLSDKLNELRDKGEGYAELHEFKNNFPKLVSENFYSETVYDCSDRNSSYIMNVKKCDNGGFSIDVNSHGQIRFSEDNDRPPQFFKHDKPIYNKLDEMLGGYIIDQRTQEHQLEAFIAWKLGIGLRFLTAHLMNISKITSLYDYTDRKKGVYLMFIDSETKKVVIHDFIEAIKKVANKHLYTDHLKFSLIKELAKDKK